MPCATTHSWWPPKCTAEAGGGLALDTVHPDSGIPLLPACDYGYEKKSAHHAYTNVPETHLGALIFFFLNVTNQSYKTLWMTL